MYKQANKINTDTNTKSDRKSGIMKKKRSMCILMEFRPNRAQRTRGRQLASCQIYTQALLEYVIIMWLRSVIKMLREISRAD